MNGWIQRKFLFVFSLAFLLGACSNIPTTDPKVSSTWQAPRGINSDTIFNASLKALSRGDLEIVSHDRQTGIITAKKVIQLPLIRIPSQIPISVTTTKTGDHSVLNTTAYLKGIGTEDAYEILLKEFYDALFLELKIVKPEEKIISRT